MDKHGLKQIQPTEENEKFDDATKLSPSKKQQSHSSSYWNVKYAIILVALISYQLSSGYGVAGYVNVQCKHELYRVWL